MPFLIVFIHANLQNVSQILERVLAPFPLGPEPGSDNLITVAECRYKFSPFGKNL